MCFGELSFPRNVIRRTVRWGNVHSQGNVFGELFVVKKFVGEITREKTILEPTFYI